jgi:hypothetical protein
VLFPLFGTRFITANLPYVLPERSINLLFALLSLDKHPQERESPFLNDLPETFFWFPQSHKHSQTAL